jgi:hypothetical protein
MVKVTAFSLTPPKIISRRKIILHFEIEILGENAFAYSNQFLALDTQMVHL